MQMPPLDPAILARRSEIVAALRALVPVSYTHLTLPTILRV